MPDRRMFSPGFEIVEGVLTQGECDDLIAYLCRDESRAGFRHLMRDPRVFQIASDLRLMSITERVFGRHLIPYKATLFQKTGKANWLVSWHQDTALPLAAMPDREDWGPASVKDGVTFAHAPTWALSKIIALRIHLDASTEANGPLRVIPGSHRKRLLRGDEFSEWTKREPIECLVGKGGVILMSPLLIHSSSKCSNDEPRRVLHIEYAAELDLGPGIKLAVA
ncbi:MAG: phytanoyl-CoA dioxygenase family protein [Pyrinomonadaceae bacterium]